MQDLAIKDVEKLLNSIVMSEASVINDAGSHILSSGGKRIRPYFVLLAGSFGQDKQHLIKTATALELIHMASLVHDDYIDDSDKRRGVQSIHQQFDSKTSIRTGHYFLAAALNLVSDIDNEAYHQYFAQVILEVCFGEFDQMYDRFRNDISFTRYLRRINRKTAILLEGSCKLGAMSTNADPQDIFHLSRFGHFMGMSFQIIDDILDFTSNEATLGKPVGSDVRNGHITLPLMCAIKKDRQLQELMKAFSASQNDAYFEEIIHRVKMSGIEASVQISRTYADKARYHLYQLKSIEARDEMEQLLDKMTNRTF